MSSFADWLKGEGEGAFGRIIRRAALRERHRLQQVLGGGGLFHHIDHETRDKIAKCDVAADIGKKKIEHHAVREKIISGLKSE